MEAVSAETTSTGVAYPFLFGFGQPVGRGVLRHRPGTGREHGAGVRTKVRTPVFEIPAADFIEPGGRSVPKGHDHVSGIPPRCRGESDDGNMVLSHQSHELGRSLEL